MKHKTLSVNNASIADTMNNLAMLYRDMGCKKKSFEYFERALEIYKKNLPGNHEFILSTMDNLDVVRVDLKKKRKSNCWIVF